MFRPFEGHGAAMVWVVIKKHVQRIRDRSLRFNDSKLQM